MQGMIGTLIGLINMLKDMGDDVGSVGPNMAVALITTLYGSLLAQKSKAEDSLSLKMLPSMLESPLVDLLASF